MIPDCALSDADLLARCQVTRCLSGGPGGQHANKTSSAVRLMHVATGCSAQCQDHRERLANQKDALRYLRLILACHQRGGADPAWVRERSQGSRLPVGAQAKGYHLVVAVLLDALDAHTGRLAEAAASLGLSTSQLVKVLCADRQVRAAADALRRHHGHGPLKDVS